MIEWIGTNENDKLLERVLWINQDKDQIVVINLSQEKPLPAIKNISMYADAISNGLAVKRTIDPSRPQNRDSAYFQKHSREIEEKWAIIKDIATDEPDIYEESLRGKCNR